MLKELDKDLTSVVIAVKLQVGGASIMLVFLLLLEHDHDLLHLPQSQPPSLSLHVVDEINVLL